MKQSDFHVGDWVTYVGKCARYNEPEMIGRIGIVTNSHFQGCVEVQWILAAAHPKNAVFPDNIELLPRLADEEGEKR